MKITEMNWMQVEAYLKGDDRAVVPIGSFPWTRVPGVEYPDEQKPMIDIERLRLHDPTKLRELLGDGNFGGFYQRPDDEMLALWKVAVEETREVIEGPWA